MDTYFWLLCGAWCGLLGGAYTYSRLRPPVVAGKLAREEVVVFTRGMALWIAVPCALLWLLQMSIPGQVPPDYMQWPALQKSTAIGLQAFVWSAFLYWVFLKGGADQLSRIVKALRSSDSRLYGPTLFKAGAIVIIALGAAALLTQGGR